MLVTPSLYGTAIPGNSDTDEYHHLHIRSGGCKVFSVAWRTGESAQIVAFRRGSWKQYFLA